MRKNLLYIILILFVGLSTFKITIAQRVLSAEYTHLLTNRSLYITGEKLEFNGLLSGEKIYSKVIYIELISPVGNKISQKKIELNNNHFIGNITIPSDILSGYYYLRAYTKWMRNGSNKNYAYVLLKIINPKTNELLPIPDSLINNKILLLDTSIKSDKLVKYQANEQINWNKEIVPLELFNFTIIPRIAAPIHLQNNGSIPKVYQELIYYPETRGLSLTGMIKSKNTGKALAFHLLSLHMIGKKDVLTVLSDAKGHFYFALPKNQGFKELFIIAESMDKDEAVIQIDQDYCFQDIALKVPPFKILDKDKAAILQMVQNQQVYHAYHEDNTITNPAINSKAFYGHAFKTIEFGYYVPLDSLEQYFTDIPSWVVIKKRKGKRYFQIYGTQGELKLYPPLVLVDWVPVDDADRVLAIHPSNVEKIDIITESYIHGDIVYGGIINIITKNADFGGLKFPKSGMYLNFEFYQAYTKDKPNDLYRNTHLWYPDISNDSLLHNSDIKAPKQKGDYLLLIQGIDKSGRAFEWKESFIVE